MNNNSSKLSVDSNRVKSCWAKIKSAKGADIFIDNFYQFMFDHHPEIHRLFPEDLSAQKISLLATLDNVINGIDYIEELENELMQLGKHHQNVKVEKEMYEIFIKTIVESANIASDFRLTDKELFAWEDAFRKISKIMLKAY